MCIDVVLFSGNLTTNTDKKVAENATALKIESGKAARLLSEIAEKDEKYTKQVEEIKSTALADAQHNYQKKIILYESLTGLAIQSIQRTKVTRIYHLIHTGRPGGKFKVLSVLACFPTNTR